MSALTVEKLLSNGEWLATDPSWLTTDDVIRLRGPEGERVYCYLDTRTGEEALTSLNFHSIGEFHLAADRLKSAGRPLMLVGEWSVRVKLALVTERTIESIPCARKAGYG